VIAAPNSDDRISYRQVGRPEDAERVPFAMTTRISRLFLLLAALQACHSVEEYVFRLWETFPPARYVTALVSADHELGFIIVNVTIVALAFATWLGPVRLRWPFWPVFVWPWVLIEAINGVGHPLWTIAEGHYTPGVVTSVLLLVVSVLLARELLMGRGARA